MLTILIHRDGKTEQVKSIERAWLRPAARRGGDPGGDAVYLWVDLAAPSIPDSLILSDTFAFHPLSVEDATSARQYPKVEAYDGYLYLILHGIDFHQGKKSSFETHDVDFFVGPSYLVTVHDGHASAVTELRDHATRSPRILGEGPVPLLHRIVDAMVDGYRPEMDKLEDHLDSLEKQVFDAPNPRLLREILDEKRQVGVLRRIVTPQRDVVARLARREFLDISTEMSFQFRDIYDHLVRVADDVLMFQDRITGMLDAHLSNVSNKLNEVMKVLTVVATLFMPPTLLAGIYGMNVPLPRFPGSDAAQFWWLVGLSAAMMAGMLGWFRRRRWI
jgi:magnesium transporter